ncbi:cytochrome c oxidase subunit II [Falsirhodobacter sp. 20TX0035]|uniref:cytochrome c oxidase subunit II n=1 Tax=Falsirhodobacter sp. 20TX0035 TaxID=3022019 RepID=UPI00232BEC6B|nr:cytochrome ubiquinol oxidase subunit II [Falsirhodobacter sp. 20TX0035]MDB6454027.1 cytochrome ubiquinol oxidase subunit II [Falsirhodobacter sp. 20TX0035]
MIRISLLVSGLWALSGCGLDMGLFSPAGPVAEAQRMHLWIVCALMLLVVIPIFVTIPFLLWRYRYRDGKNHASYRPDWEASWRWEVMLWSGPLVVTAALGWFLWTYTKALDPYRPLSEAPLQVQVVSYDWKWLFIYPDLGVASVDRLVLPAGQAVTLSLTSRTVMQSMLIPELAGQIYLMNGMTTHLNLSADHPGQWTGRNTQYNGDGFHRQTFRAEAMAPSDFARWAETAANAPPLDQPALAALEERGRDPDLPDTFGQVPPHLFHDLAGTATHAHHGGGQ